MDAAIEVSGLRHTFGRGGPNEVVALDGVDLTAEPGSFIVVFGTNGSGKSTLLSAIAGDFVPDDGSIRLGGVDVTRRPAHERARRVSRVSQSPQAGTAPRLTVADNLALAERRISRGGGLRLALSAATRRHLADGVAGRFEAVAGHLSGGAHDLPLFSPDSLVRSVPGSMPAGSCS